MAMALDRLPASTARRPGDAVDQLGGGPGGLGVIRAEQDIRLELMGEVAELPGRQVVQGGGDHGAGNGFLDPGRDRPARRDQGDELVAHPDQGVGHGHDHLAGQALGHRCRGGGGRVPWGGHDDQVGRGRLDVVAAGDRQVRAWANAPGDRADLLSPLLRPGPDDDLESGRGQAHGQSLSRRAGSSKHSDAHATTFARSGSEERYVAPPASGAEIPSASTASPSRWVERRVEGRPGGPADRKGPRPARLTPARRTRRRRTSRSPPVRAS